MSLPVGLTTLTVTGTYTDATGAAQAGSVSFTPTSAVVDAAGKVILTGTTIVGVLDSAGSFSVTLPCTDNAGLVPLGWAFSLAVNVPGAQVSISPVYLPHALGATVDITALTASTAAPAPSGVSYIPDATAVPAAGPSGGGGFLYADDGSLFWINPGNTVTQIAPDASQGGGSVSPVGPASGDLSGSYPNPTVAATHLTAALPVAQGGTGAGTQQAAITALTGAQVSGRYLRSDGVNAALAAIQAADVPTLTSRTRAPTFTVAASNSPAAATSTADYVCTGTGDQATIAAAITALPGTGGTIYLESGTYSFNATLTIGSSDVVVEFAGGAVISWASVTGTTAIVQVAASSVILVNPQIQGSGAKGNGTGILLVGTSTGVHDCRIENPQLSNLNTGICYGIVSTFSTGDCASFSGVIHDCATGIRNQGFPNRAFSTRVYNCTICVDCTNDRSSQRFEGYSLTLAEWSGQAIRIRNGNGSLFVNTWMEHTNASLTPTEAVLIGGLTSLGDATNAEVSDARFGGATRLTLQGEASGFRLVNCRNLAVDSLTLSTTGTAPTQIVLVDATVTGANNTFTRIDCQPGSGGLNTGFSPGPGGITWPANTYVNNAAQACLIVKEVPGVQGATAGSTLGGGTPAPSQATYYIDHSGSPGSATYWGKASNGHMALVVSDTASTSGLKAVIEGLAASGVHLHFGPGRFHFIDAPAGTEAWANTQTGSSLAQIRGLVLSGEGCPATIISNRSNTITGSPDLGIFLFTNCSYVVIRDMSIEFCGAYMSTMEAANFNQGTDCLIDRVKFSRSKASVLTFDGGDVGKTAKRDVVRNCIFQGRPETPQVDLIPSGGTLTNGTPYTYLVAYRDQDVGYFTGVTATTSSTTATLTTGSAHGFATGETVTVQAMSVSGYNGVFVLTGTPTATTFTYTVASTLGAGSGATVVGPATTKPSDPSTAVTPGNGTSSTKVYLPVGPYTTTQRIVYRYDGSSWVQAAVIADNTTLTWTDTGVAGTGVSMPVSNHSLIPHAGVQLLAAKGVLVDGNVVDGAGDPDITGTAPQGIRLAQKQNVSCDHNIIVSNRVRQSGSHGIYIAGGSRNVISGNVVSNPGTVAIKAQAIRVEGNAAVNTIRNQIFGNNTYDDQTAASWSGGASTSNSFTIAATGTPTSTMLGSNSMTGYTSSSPVSDQGTLSELEADEKTIVLLASGTLTTATKVNNFNFACPWPGLIKRARLYVDTAPTGQAIICDYLLNGTTIWSTQGNRVQIAATANSGTQTSFNTTSFTTGDVFTFNIAQVGSGTPGANLVMELTVLASRVYP